MMIGKNPSQKLCEYEDTVAVHIMLLRGYLAVLDVAHEDVKMKLFIMSLDLGNNKDVEDWYDELPDKGISSLVHLVKAFGK